MIKDRPTFSAVVKIANAMDVELIDLYQADQIPKDVNSFDKSLAENLRSSKLSSVEPLKVVISMGADVTLSLFNSATAFKGLPIGWAL